MHAKLIMGGGPHTPTQASGPAAAPGRRSSMRAMHDLMTSSRSGYRPEQAHRASWHLTPGFLSGPLTLPSEPGGCPVAHPVVPIIQALSKHTEQLVALPDDLRQQRPATGNYHSIQPALLELRVSHHTELAECLAAERSPRRCPSRAARAGLQSAWA